MTDRDEDRLHRIVRLIDLIRHDIGNIDQRAFFANSLLVDGTAHRLMHVAENAMHLSDAVKARHAAIPWRRIAGLRNYIAHDYDGANLITVWGTIENNLTPVREMCLAELAADQIQGE